MTRELLRAPESLSVWEGNMKELEARQPNLAVKLHNYVKEHGHSFEHHENRTPAGKWVEGLAGEPFFERAGEPRFNWNKKKREDKNKPVFILYGVGTPPYLFKAIRALPDAALAFIVAEPNLSLLAYTLHLTHVYLAMPKGCRLAFLTEGDGVGETEKERKESEFSNSQTLCAECLTFALRPIGTYAAALSELSAHPGELDMWKDRFSKLGSAMREWFILTLTYLGNSAEDTLLGLRQIALMAPQITFGASIELLRDKYKGRPVVSVASGPSLDKNFMLLKDIQDKCVIIACDSNIEKLLANGIKPHVVTILERCLENYTWCIAKVVDKYRDECRDILMVAQALSVPWASCRWPGPVCLVCKEEVIADKWLCKMVLGGRSMSSGTSVANMNYSIAALIGAPSVAFIGQDLAFSEEGASHAGDIGSEWMIESGRLQVPGALGGMVTTDKNWLAFLRLLENMIKAFKLPTWDCTEGGR